MKIWPLSLKIALLLCKVVLSYLHLMWRVFPLGCVPYSLCCRWDLFYSPHVSARNVALLSNSQYKKALNLHRNTHGLLSLYQSTWKRWCTLNHFYFSNSALKRNFFRQLGVLSVTVAFISKQKYEITSVHFCRNIRQISIDIPTHYNGICDNLTSVAVNGSSNYFNSFSSTVSHRVVGAIPPNAAF